MTIPGVSNWFEWTQSIKGEDAGYTAERMAADLSRLLENLAGADDLEIAPIRDSRQGFYIYNRKQQQGRYFGLLRFKKG